MRDEGNFDLEEFRWLVAKRHRVSPETVRFYGELLEAARRAAASRHPAERLLLVAGLKDELVDLPSPVDILHSKAPLSPRSKPIDW